MTRHLTLDFLAPYLAKRDNFSSLLARSVYTSKYRRGSETWAETVRRCVEGNVAHDPAVTEDEARKLYHAMFTMQFLPPGRGLWTGGVPGMPVEALYNCHATTLRTPEDWCWLADMLMCGGGVGIGLYDVAALPVLPARPRGQRSLAIACVASHPDHGDVAIPWLGPIVVDHLPGALLVEDSRQGWVDAIRQLFRAAWTGQDFAVDLSQIRQRGAPIRTFGGIAPGPAPLAMLIRALWRVLRGAAGRRLTSVECLDITNFIGLCVKSGNVRRSALIALGDAHDQPFRDAKKDLAAVISHRSTSNNSIVLRTHADVTSLDYRALARDLATTGEPGIVNLSLARPGEVNCNPCAEILLENREACCLSELFPSNRDGRLTDTELLRLAARYTLRQRMAPMVDAEAEEVRKRNMRIGVGLGGVCDFEWSEAMLRDWYRTVREEADTYADFLGVARPIATTTVKPGGTVSLVAGTSPGMHAPFADYYLRRTRIADNEPMAAALREAGLPHEVDQYDKTGRTLVFEFPVRSHYRGPTVQTESTRDQFERQAALQRAWSDNAVSATIGFTPGDEGHLAELLREYVPHLKSTSCLPRDGGLYPQAPYQVIDRAEYKERFSRIRHDHPLTVEVDDALQVDECAAGACPAR
jgi:ribonucleoside-triphosphate reductase